MASLLTIPEPIRESLSQLAFLSEDQVTELLKALSTTAPAVYRRDVVTQITQKVESIPSDEIDNIVQALFGLSVGRLNSEVSISEFVQDVAGLFPEIEGETLELFKRRITNLLDVDCLKIGAKAYELLFEHEHNFLDARVLTDVRPVFGDAPNDLPIGAMIVHTLKLNYVESDRPQTFYVALDERDIKRLVETLDRAKSKATVLKSVLVNTNVPYVGME